MRPLSLAEIQSACAASLLHGSSTILCKRVCIDSRALQPGDLFVAIVGERFDGHDFAAEALERGAAAVLISRPVPIPSDKGGVLLVTETVSALQSIAAWYRTQCHIPIVAVAGSNGKTSTKEMCAAALSCHFSVAKTQGNLNNHLGVPLTLLSIGPEHSAAVIELGTNHPGELAQLAGIVQPSLGILTNIGHEHLEFLIDEEGVAREEGALLEALGSESAAILNADDPWTPRLRQRTAATVITAGFASGADIRIQELTSSQGGQRLRIESEGLRREFWIPLPGRHMASNASLAIAAAVALCVPPDEIGRGLITTQLPTGRVRVLGKNGIDCIDDTYNANPSSMKAALELLGARPGRRIAVLGTMGELGSDEARWHRQMGEVAAAMGVDMLLAVGPFAISYREGAGARTSCFENAQEACAWLLPKLQAGDTVLVKASRSARLERVVEGLGFASGGGH